MVQCFSSAGTGRWTGNASAPSTAEDAVYWLGILADTFTHYEQSEPLERDMMRPRLLRAFGWKVTSVLAKDWYEDQAAEIARLPEMLNE